MREFIKIHRYFFSLVFLGAIYLIFLAVFVRLDNLFPLSLPQKDAGFAVTVTAWDGSPLRSFPDENGVWRYPVAAEGVSPRYIEALLHYEDRYFRHHPGVNPWSLFRALLHYAADGVPRTGGSTLTMQTARLFHPHDKTIPGKIYQIFRALQLEYHLTKEEILTLYLNYAPFGGTVEGVQAASFSYLGKPAAELSHAEAALLAVLPQAPTRLRPDLHPDRAQRARDKVIDRMVKFRVWDPETGADAKMERVYRRFDSRPMKAPLLARRLKDLGRPDAPLRTTIDPFLQETVSEMVRGYIAGTPAHTSAAAILVENQNLAVRAYVGSADFTDNDRYGHVDMIRAVRSPGSALKPFLYGFALEEGLIHSESLLVDAPLSFDGYRPGNFTESFSGPVSASEALRRSLNIPAVDLCDRIGPRFFDARLRQGGLHLQYPAHGKPNLSMILGGAGVSLEDLTAAYTAFGRDGLSGKLRFIEDAPLEERRMLSPGGAYIIRTILADHRRPDLPSGRLRLESAREVAWKTGTSYGFRDAWTFGVTDRYTIGVWVGRPDGTPSPGQYGRATAAPLLFSIADSLPRSYEPKTEIPKSVERTQICWPLGIPAQSQSDPHCHESRGAWILNRVIPPTLPDRADQHWQANPLTVMIRPETGLRVEADCPVSAAVPVTIARWPKGAGPWLSPHIRRRSRIPKLDPICNRPAPAAPDSVAIMGFAEETVLRPPGAFAGLPTVTLQAQGGQGGLFWMLNGELIARTAIDEPRIYRFQAPGRYGLTVMDLAGNYDSVEILVLGGRGG